MRNAVIIDHLTATDDSRRTIWGNLQKLEALIDEYYEAQSLNPSRLNLISDRITKLIEEEQLDRELGIEN